MEFDDLQAIWDVQNEKPVFSMKDARLAIGLYQQRERSRRRIFWRDYFPLYVITLGMIAGVAFLFVAFYWKSVYIERIGRDFPMTSWDYMAFGLSAATFLAMMILPFLERRKHERAQNTFAPSLREELDRGISQIDFVLNTCSLPRVIRINVLVTIGTALFCWEVGRLNGKALPWGLMLTLVPSVAAGVLLGLAARKKTIEKLMPRKRALERMRSALNEEPLS